MIFNVKIVFEKIILRDLQHTNQTQLFWACWVSMQYFSLERISFMQSMFTLLLAYFSDIFLMVFSSFKFLFLVSCLQSSQNTNESLLFGSLCSSKQDLQMLCPHDNVKGFCSSYKQLKQLIVLSIGFVFNSFFSSILLISSVREQICLIFWVYYYSSLTHC